MNYWILKTEPHKYSWDQLVKDKSTFWDGVRNYQARNNMNAMKKGDLALIYHSNVGKEIVGIAEIIKTASPDHTIKDDRWVGVEIKAKKALKKPVTLHEMKTVPKLDQLALIRQGRLSVCPVTPEEWKILLDMSETKI